MPEIKINTWSRQMGSAVFAGKNKEEVDNLTVAKIEEIRSGLIGFTQQEARQILECVVEELSKQTDGILHQLTVLA